MVTTLFFDLDDTLVDWRTARATTLKFLAEQLTVANPELRHDSFMDMLIKEIFLLFHRLSTGKLTPQDAQLQMVSYFLNNGFDETIARLLVSKSFSLLIKSTKAFADVEILGYLANKYTLGIISNGHHHYQTQKLQLTKLKDYFSVIICSSELGVVKPNREIFQEALERTGVAAVQAVMVGNNYEKDVLGAAGVNMTGIWLQREGGNGDCLESSDKFSRITTLSQLPRLLDQEQ